MWDAVGSGTEVKLAKVWRASPESKFQVGVEGSACRKPWRDAEACYGVTTFNVGEYCGNFNPIGPVLVELVRVSRVSFFSID